MSEMNFAEKLTRLEEITRYLENGECSLEDAMKLYEEGKKIAADCGKTLKEAKQKLEVAEVIE